MTDLCSPGRIGAVELRNRVVMPAMTTRLAAADGSVTDASIAYFRARAAGGTALLTVEMASPERAGKHRAHELGICEDRYVPGLARLVAAIHSEGARASIQLGHAGGHTRADISGEPPVAPSAIPHYVHEVTGATIVPEAMTVERIAAATRAFVEAARRAREAGFDCVEVHAAHGYLLSQFLCPAENQRTDEYGGPLANRARLALEIVRGIRAGVPGIAVIFRVNVDDFFPGGLVFEDGLEAARMAAAAGADAIHVTAGHYRSQPSAHMMTPPMNCPEGIFLDYAAKVRAAVPVPVIAVGRLGNPEVAQAAISGGKADFIALGRPLLADPDWVRKTQRGEAVRRCLACNTCVDEMRSGARLGCVVNPVAGREVDSHAQATARGERIAVIGAGPAGLTYAALAAEGNSVTVFERQTVSGGAFRLAGLAPRFQGVEAVPDSLVAFTGELERACRARGVEFRHGVDPLAGAGALAGFDRVVIATGARYRYGLGILVPGLLRSGLARAWPLRALFAAERVRDWFYHRGRTATGPRLRGRVDAAIAVEVIGDASAPGRCGAAIASAHRAAFAPRHAATPQ